MNQLVLIHELTFGSPDAGMVLAGFYPCCAKTIFTLFSSLNSLDHFNQLVQCILRVKSLGMKSEFLSIHSAPRVSTVRINRYRQPGTAITAAGAGSTLHVLRFLHSLFRKGSTRQETTEYMYWSVVRPTSYYSYLIIGHRASPVNGSVSVFPLLTGSIFLVGFFLSTG